MAIVVLGLPAWGRAQTSNAEAEQRRCLNCHGQPHIADLSPTERASMVAGAPAVTADTPKRRPELFVDAAVLGSSLHGKVTCVSCHANAKQLPHAADMGAVSCNGSCHTLEGSAYRKGAHAEAAARGDAQAPTCSTCHGGHDVLPPSDRKAHTHPLNIVKICGDCHKQHQQTPSGINGAQAVDDYLDSVHGKAVGAGLVVAATCVDCHKAHEVKPSAAPDSSVNRQNVADTCGQCHTGVSEMYLQSIHGQKLAAGDKQAPVCNDCHTAHAITRASTPGFMLDIVNECGVCHDQMSRQDGRSSLYRTYRMSYHGQVTKLGSERAARCSSCHGAHDILPADNPLSRVHDDNLVSTCGSCHPDASASFVLFEPHADHRDGERFPLLNGVWLYFMIVMSGTFGFFGLHTLLWFVRSSVDRLKHGPHPRPAPGTPGIRRFSQVDRLNHAAMVISFFGLTLTGLPLLFSDQAWSGVMVEFFGGAHSAGLLHRIFAIMLLANFAVHGAAVIHRIKQHGARKVLMGPNTMLPRWKDVTDFIGMVKWFFGAKKKPAFDHWTYWEKFDYWAEIFGTMVIGGSGLVLWFPTFFAQYLPGWMFNIAMIVHGYEALLAIVFIFTIHFFNANLRWEKFPVDDVIFTGAVPEEELKHERGVEYDRLVASGELAAMREQPIAPWLRRAGVCAGIVAMLIGIGMAVLIVLAGLELL